MAQLHGSAFPQDLVIYQIYPRSFKDTNGDGIGDLQGIIQKLDYLQSLGVTALWLNPVAPSPMVDFGYDIQDYYGIDAVFGTMEDFSELIQAAHERQLQVIMDLVLNHTSDQHSWFQAAKASRDNSYRDWYVWRDPKADGSPPNNWLSLFGGSAWELDEASGQYYLHTFFKQQPDLNWGNPDVRAAIQQIMSFWLDRGIDGFRLDAVYWYAKDPNFRDEPINPNFHPATDSPYMTLQHLYSKDDPMVYIYLNELAEHLIQHGSGFMIMEVNPDNPLDIPSYRKFYDAINPSVAAPFNFGLLTLPWQATAMKQFIDKFQQSLQPGDTPVYVNGNHDQPRLASRIGEPATPACALLQLTLPGSVVIYYGEELGMQSVPISPSYMLDGYEKNIPGRGKGRDPERTPMQWSAEPYAGFSTTAPWLPVSSDYKQRNVAVESQEEDSLLHLYRKLLKLRHESIVLQIGSYLPMDFMNDNLFGFKRQADGQTLTIIANFSTTETIPIAVEGALVLSTIADPATQQLQPLEARIIKS